MSSSPLWGCTSFVFFNQAFEIQKRFLKTKHLLLSSNPRILLVCGHRGSWFRPGWRHCHPINYTWSLVLLATKERYLQTQLQLTWPSLWKQLSSHQWWRELRATTPLTEVPQLKCQPEVKIQNHTDWDTSAWLVHIYPELIHNVTCVTGRTDRAGKAD